MSKNKKTKDVDFASKAVPADSRKGLVTMFMIMLGFTFFSASMWVGQQLAEGLDFWGFVKSLILGGVILGAYTGLLGYYPLTFSPEEHSGKKAPTFHQP